MYSKVKKKTYFKTLISRSAPFLTSDATLNQGIQALLEQVGLFLNLKSSCFWRCL